MKRFAIALFDEARANDMDDDGRVSPDEFAGHAASWIATMDRNGDGVVTTADFGRA